VKSTISLKAVIRTGFKLGICVLLGGMTTVAVTWGLAMFLPSETARRSFASKVAVHTETHRKAIFMLSRAERPGYLAVSSTAPTLDQHGNFVERESTPRIQDVMPEWASRRVEQFWNGPYGQGAIALESFGWPWPAGYAEIGLVSNYSAQPTFTVHDHTGLMVKDRLRKMPFYTVLRPVVLPLRPIWRGLAIDIAVYSSAWLVMVVGVGTARRWNRSVRGRCPRCAYDLKGQATPGCPECGWKRLESTAEGTA